ncbi:MAG: phosphoribosylglycinamide formyltransferase-1 [Alphaproteobacteria bacterium]|jgi:phosphoribosylglycinamide formyltransferase-1
MKKNIAILISGTGSNMEVLIKATQGDGDSLAHIACVISDKVDAKGLLTAQELGIKTYFIDPSGYESKQAYEAILHQTFLKHHIDFICLAGFMRLMSAYLCDLWQHKMINIHPSLLPAFKGLDTYQKAIEAGVKFSGCTVHYVSEKMDSGKIIAQAVVPVLWNDTPNMLAKRILSAEHKLYPLTLKALCNEELYNQTLSFYQAV